MFFVNLKALLKFHYIIIGIKYSMHGLSPAL